MSRRRPTGHARRLAASRGATDRVSAAVADALTAECYRMKGAGFTEKQAAICCACGTAYNAALMAVAAGLDARAWARLARAARADAVHPERD